MSLSASIDGWPEPFASRAEPGICTAAQELGGFLLIVTHAADPFHLDGDQLMKAFASPATLTGWAQA